MSQEWKWSWADNSDALEKLRKMVMVDVNVKLAVNWECLRHLQPLDVFWFDKFLGHAESLHVFCCKWHNGDNVIKEELKRGYIGEKYPKSEGCWLRHKWWKTAGRYGWKWEKISSVFLFFLLTLIGSLKNHSAGSFGRASTIII